MATEIEGRILNVNPEDIKAKLDLAGAEFLGHSDFKRYTFDSVPKVQGRWGRLRTDGRQTTLTVKEITNNSLSGTLEWEVEISDFEETRVILEKLGLKYTSYQENTRDEYLLENAKISINHWPVLGHILEIEVQKEEDIIELAKTLGFTEKDVVSTDISSLYKEIGINLDRTEKLVF